MALFGLGKKKGAQAPSAPSAPGAVASPSSPVDQVMSLRQQGVPNDKIIQTLQRSGFSSSKIFDAMSQADTMGPAGPVTPPEAGEVPPQAAANPAIPPPPGAEGTPQPPVQSGFEPHSTPPPISEQPQTLDRDEIEEVAESIIDEKWQELTKNISKIVDWKNATETKIITLNQQFKDLKADFENLHSALIGKVNEYDQNILNVGTEIKAMEKVFQKVLPTFTENVSELSRITGKIKKRK
tara:strand:- start:255 stop:971 length:717 start_codon:yes stop_codon:yes gene_type:complete